MNELSILPLTSFIDDRHSSVNYILFCLNYKENVFCNAWMKAASIGKAKLDVFGICESNNNGNNPQKKKRRTNNDTNTPSSL